jgi:tetratricopeptide (TPR) repeat protein
MDYTAQRLRLRTPTGREVEIPAWRIERLEAEWTAPHVEADRRWAENRWDEARRKYAEAYAADKRAWVRQRILAQIVWCHRALEQFELAGDVFAQMVRYTPDTPYLDAIPLVWQSRHLPSSELERRAQVWLEVQNSPAVTLMGASWLLSGRDAGVARQRLQSLRSSPDRAIAALAQAQLWRQQVVTATEADLAQWQSTVEAMPPSLRAGPYYVLGKALGHHDRFEDAALAMLRVPILYPRHRMLAAEALIGAGQWLERLGQSGEAVRLYQETAMQYPGTDAAQLARQQMLRLSKPRTD